MVLLSCKNEERSDKTFERKGLTVTLPLDLHSKFTAERERQNYANNSDYLEEILKEYYEIIEKGVKAMEIRTLAIQIPTELMENLDKYLAEKGMKKKQFLTNLIETALEDAEKAELNNNFTTAESSTD